LGKTLKLKGYLMDKKRLFELKLKYSTDTGLAEVKSFRRGDREKYAVSSDHIFLQKKGPIVHNVVFLDNARRMSVGITGDEPIDQKKSIGLSILTEKSFWQGLIASKKLAISTMLIMLCAGAGLYHFIVLIMRAFGLKV